MSDHIEIDGRKYFEESYLALANNNAARCREAITEKDALIASQAAEIASREAELNAVEEDRDDWRNEHQKAAQELDEYRPKVREQAAEIERLEGKVKACHNRIDDDTETIERQAALIQSMRQALEELSGECTSWSRGISECDPSQKFRCRSCIARAALAQVSASPLPQTTVEALLVAIEGLRVAPNCWCSTGEGNPHTQECLDMANAVAVSASPKEEQPK